MNRKMVQGGSFSGNERDCLFLNTGGPRFANLSGASGIDFPDDGRAVAAVDFDQDGDLDLWEVNRTGPQVRYLENQIRSGFHFVALRLVGRPSGAHPVNRDAIGARVEVSAGGRKLARSLRAGDGFLTQTTKWIHVGLGTATAIDRIVVRWPGGGAEEFRGAGPDGRFELVQGTGVATPSARRAQTAAPAPENAPEAAPGVPPRTPLSATLPMPKLRYTDGAGSPKQLDLAGGRPTLVNLWASYCKPCVAELSELAAERARVQASGVRVVALSVEDLDEESAVAGVASAKALLARIGFPFESGFATAGAIDRLQAVHGALFRLDRPLPLPSSFLVDGEGRLAVIYKGAVAIPTLLADAAALRSPPEDLRAAAQPFPGRWIAPPSPKALQKRLSALAQSYAEREWFAEAAQVLREIVRVRPDDEYAHLNLGASLARLGDLDGAIAALGEAIRLNPRNEIARQDLAQMRAARNLSSGTTRDGQTAVAELRAALSRKPDDARTEHRLAFVLATDPSATVRDGREAVRLAEEVAARTRRRVPEVLDTLAAAYAEVGRFPDALAASAQAVKLADAARKPELAATFRQRQALYRSGQPLRIAAGPASP